MKTGDVIDVGLVVFCMFVLVAPILESTLSQAVQEKKACIENLRQIEKAKEQWAAANMKVPSDAVVEAEVNKFIKGGAPKCPAGGTYTYRPVGTHPTCNHKSGQHKLP